LALSALLYPWCVPSNAEIFAKRLTLSLQYQAETAPSQIRGTLTATYQLFITFGILVSYCISIGTRNIEGAGSWQTVVGIGIAWPTILIIGILFMPESPR